MVVRSLSVVCGKAASLLITTRPATAGAHDYSAWREAKSPLNKGVAMRFGTSTEGHGRDRAKTHKCQPMPAKHANVNE
eukprot:2047741-Pleurochrysis_carterae.AAC.1